MSDVFREWLLSQIKNRQWSLRELARQSGVSHPHISQVLSGQVAPGADFCIKIAQAIGHDPVIVLRLAGILPSDSIVSDKSVFLDDITLQEIIELAKDMTPENKRDLLDYARFRFRQQQDRRQADDKT